MTSRFSRLLTSAIKGGPLEGNKYVTYSRLQELSIFLALILIILTSGCAGPKLRTYSGDEIQKAEVAVIQGRYYFTPLYYDSVIIYNIDDGKFLGVTNAEVLPGCHELVIKHYVFNLLGGPAECVRVAFNFEAGHEYKIKAPPIVDTGDLMEIIDNNTGVIIVSQAWVPCAKVLRWTPDGLVSTPQTKQAPSCSDHAF